MGDEKAEGFSDPRSTTPDSDAVRGRAPALLCAALEIALNRYLRLEPAALAECAALEGRRIALHAGDLGWTFTIEPIATGVRVTNDSGDVADVRVQASSLKLLRLALQGVRGDGALPAGLEVQGDTELLRRFNGILARVGFDPEELLAKFLPEGAAHRVNGGIQGLFGWTRRAGKRFGEDAAEYLSEETEDLARSADIEEWMSAVDELREGADRLEARIARLEGEAAA